MALPREEILKQVSDAIDAAEERAAEIERDARDEAEALLADARADAKRLLERAQSAVAGIAAEISAEVPEPAPPAPEPEPPAEPVPDPTPLPRPPPEQPPPAAAGANGDDSGARLVAMKMALDGTSREEVARHLAESHGIADIDTLLDDVFARVGR